MDIVQDRLSIIDGPLMVKIDKNWVPIGLSGSEINFLCSTGPFITAQYNVNTGNFSRKIMHHSSSKVHNGSNLIRVQPDLFIRVVRERYNVEKGRAIHLSTIICHNAELVEMHRTKPFVFTEFAYEICNSIIEFKNHVFFLWGHNDETALMGYIGKDSLVEWIYQN
jgi:hypothetical protein